MKPSRPPSLLTLVRRTLLDECGVSRGDSILVATSGGGDSTALLHCLLLLAERMPLVIRACGVDHGLRAEAFRELELVERLCAHRSLPFFRVSVEVPPGGNLQARAREARYAALRDVQQRTGSRWLATAHHADDRAETVLIRLLRGAPPRGLAVLPPRAADLIRPMIRARRADVERHLRRHGLTHAEDPSNHDARFLRVRLRREILPLLSELSPGIVTHLCTLADELSLPELPPLHDPDGAELRLGRAQRHEIRKAQRDRSGRARVLLKGARVLRVSPKTGLAEIAEEDPSGGSAPKTPPSR